MLTRPKRLLSNGERVLHHMLSLHSYTSVPIEPALKIIRSLLGKDEKLQDRDVLSVQHIIDLLGFCLNNTYFSFSKWILWTGWGCSNGVTGLPPIPLGIGIGLWMTHGSFNKVPINKDFWSTSIALIQQSKFTVQGSQGNGGIPFLDTWVTPEADNSLSITVYHQPTQTDQYLQWDSTVS